MTFDRNANLKAWRAANPERYLEQRRKEYALRRKRRAAAKKARLAEERELKRAARAAVPKPPRGKRSLPSVPPPTQSNS